MAPNNPVMITYSPVGQGGHTFSAQLLLLRGSAYSINAYYTDFQKEVSQQPRRTPTHICLFPKSNCTKTNALRTQKNRNPPMADGRGRLLLVSGVACTRRDSVKQPGWASSPSWMCLSKHTNASWFFRKHVAIDRSCDTSAH